MARDVHGSTGYRARADSAQVPISRFHGLKPAVLESAPFIYAVRSIRSALMNFSAQVRASPGLPASFADKFNVPSTRSGLLPHGRFGSTAPAR